MLGERRWLGPAVNGRTEKGRRRKCQFVFLACLGRFHHGDGRFAAFPMARNERASGARGTFSTGSERNEALRVPDQRFAVQLEKA